MYVNAVAREPVVKIKLVSVDRALKELQNDTLFPASCLVYLAKFSVTWHRFFKHLYLYLQQYKGQPKMF